jgi:hypothetical protein
MPAVAITSVVGVNSQPGSQLTVSGTWSQVSRIVVSIRCRDEQGIWHSLTLPGTGNPPIVLDPNGTFTATIASPCGCGKQMLIVVDGYDGNAHTAQDQFSTTLECGSPCCPRADQFSLAVQPGGCTSDCKRKFGLTLSYDGEDRPGCPPVALLQVAILDSSNAAVAYLPAVSFPLSGLFSQNWPAVQALPGGSYKAAITVFVDGQACAAVSLPFDLEPCESPPHCPSDLALSASPLGCSSAAGGCLPAAQFVISGTFAKGCGAAGATVLTLDYGDGFTETLIVPNAGFQQLVKVHHYATGGVMTATLTVTHPSGCSPSSVTATVKLLHCKPEDCVSCGEPPKAPSWCLCKSCWLFSRKPGKWFCKPLMALMIILISSATISLLHGWILVYGQEIWINALAAIGFLGTAFLLTVYAKLCGKCCAACVIWPGVILGIFGSLLIWIVWGIVPNVYSALAPIIAWLLRLIGLLFVAAVLYWIYNEDCKKEEEEQLNDEDWCKEAE